MTRRRKDWRRAAQRFGAERLVFLDESGATTDMTRRFGRGPRGERVAGAVPGGTWRTTAMLAAIRSGEVFAPFAFEGAADAAAFQTYVERILAPVLRPGEVVVMDDLGVHKSPAVAEAVRAAGAAVRDLPPDSPDLDPIEKPWSKVKTHLRAAAARTQETLDAAVGAGLRAVRRSDCHGWFRSCGYRTPVPKPL